MPKITRIDIVARAKWIAPLCGYIYGGEPVQTNRRCRMGSDGRGVEYRGSSGLLTADCASFCAFAWGLNTSDTYSGYFHDGTLGQYFGGRKSGNTYQEIYSGISAGDVLWKQGHVALYIGANQILEFYTQNWVKTPSKQGYRYSSSRFDFNGYCSYDGVHSYEWSTDPDDPNYNPDFDPEKDPSPEYNPTYPFYPNPPEVGDVSDDTLNLLIHNREYTKRYDLMKHYRR